MDKDVIAKEIKNLDTKMSVPQDHIPVKKLKNNIHEKQTYRHYRLIDLSKLLERCLCDQIYQIIDNTLSRHQMGNRKVQLSTFIDCDV